MSTSPPRHSCTFSDIDWHVDDLFANALRDLSQDFVPISNPSVIRSVSPVTSATSIHATIRSVSPKLTSHSIESVGQAAGVRSDRRCRQLRLGIDTAACRTVVLARHPATRGYRCHWDAEAGVQYSTAGKSIVCDEGRRLLVSKKMQKANS